MTVARPALPQRALLGEGARWDPATGRLLWVDVYQGIVHRCRVESGEDDPLSLGEPVGCVALTDDEKSLVCALESGVVLAREDGTRVRIAPFADPGHRLNDGATDPTGRFWVGSMAHGGATPTGELYRLDPGAGLRRVLAGVTISNGLAFDAERERMYYVDSGTGRLDVLCWDPADGAVDDRRPQYSFSAEQGSPDGVAIDRSGTVWVAMWGGGSVLAIAPDGRLVDRVDVPTPLVTSCAFGGDDYSTLFVTTARGDWPDFVAVDDARAGMVFAAEVETRGGPTTPLAAGNLTAAEVGA